MALTKYTQHSFTRGEAPSDLTFRADSDLYGVSAKTLTNFITTPAGGQERRPGFEFVKSYAGQQPLRLLPFTFSEVTQEPIVIFKDGAQTTLDVVGDRTYGLPGVLDAYDPRFWTGSHYTPYLDTLIFAHQDFKPVQITRGVDTWSASQIAFKNPPFWRFDTETLISTHSDPVERANPEGDILTGSTNTAVASNPIYKADQVGKKFRFGIGPNGIAVEMTRYVSPTEMEFVVNSPIPEVEFQARQVFAILNNELWEVEPGAESARQGTLLRGLPDPLDRPAAMAFVSGRVMILSENHLWEIDPDSDDDAEGALLRDVPPTITNPTGMVEVLGELYVGDESNGQIWRIDPDGANSQGTLVAKLPRIGGTSLAGMANLNDELLVYRNLTRNGQLIKVDPTSSEATNYEVLATINTEHTMVDLVVWSGELYTLDLITNTLWRIGTTRFDITRARKMPSYSPRALATQTAFAVIDPDIKKQYRHMNASNQWAEEAWSDERGWPRTFIFHQGRLVAGGSRSLPSVIFGSRAGDPFDFYNSDLITDGFIKEVQSDQREYILHMVSKTDLHIITTGATYILRGIGTADPGQSEIVKQNTVGALNLRPVDYRENIIFVADNSASVYYNKFNRDIGQYKSINLTTISPGSVQNPVSLSMLDDWKDRYSLLLAVNDNNTISCLQLNEDQEVWGWSKWVTEGGQFLEGARVGSDYYVLIRRDGDIYLERLSNVEGNHLDHSSILIDGIADAEQLSPLLAAGVDLNAATPQKTLGVRRLNAIAGGRAQLQGYNQDRDGRVTYVGLHKAIPEFESLPFPFILGRSRQLVIGHNHVVHRIILMTSQIEEFKVRIKSKNRQGNRVYETETRDVIIETTPGEEETLIPTEVFISALGTSHTLVITTDTATKFELLGYSAEANVREHLGVG